MKKPNWEDLLGKPTLKRINEFKKIVYDSEKKQAELKKRLIESEKRLQKITKKVTKMTDRLVGGK